MDILQDVDLRPFNTFGIHAIAERLVCIRSQEELSAYFETNEPKPSLVLGGGSNMLFTQNIAGTTLKIELPGINVVHEDEGNVWVEAGAGVVWHEFVLYAISKGWGGVENLSLIPGNVGAAPMQNIGAYGVELKDVFHELTAYLIDDKCFESFGLNDCAFGYRESVFKHALKNKAVISAVTLKLSKKPALNTSYGAIESELERMGVRELNIKAVSDAVIAIRQSKLPDPKKIGNSGSFFKNPIIERSQFEALRETHPNIVGYPSDGAHVKVAAGWLIEQAGFKGKRFGQCGVHDKQALVLVNYGDAQGHEVYDLSEKIIQSIKSIFGITLEREVNII